MVKMSIRAAAQPADQDRKTFVRFDMLGMHDPERAGIVEHELEWPHQRSAREVVGSQRAGRECDAAPGLDAYACAQAAVLLRERGAKVRVAVADVGREEDVRRAVGDIEAALGPAQVLVNNAGFARDGLLADMSAADWDAVQAVHLRGAFLMTRAVLPSMAQARWGRVVNISSISALGHAERVNYCAAKAGLLGMSKALAVELGPQGITVNAVAPGLIVTRMTDATAARRGVPLARHLQDAAARIPVRRVGNPDDIAAAVAYFAGEEAGFVTGQVLYVAGGPCD
jgi:3-oxoacyl-[acyl-carrier protein] reductase